MIPRKILQKIRQIEVRTNMNGIEFIGGRFSFDAVIARPRQISCRYEFGAFDAAQPRGISDSGSQVSRFEVGIVRQNLLLRHVAAQQIQKKFHRVAQTANARLAVAEAGVYRDARKQLFARHAKKMAAVVSRRKREAETGKTANETVIQKIFDESPVL